jgi:cytochrome c553
VIRALVTISILGVVVAAAPAFAQKRPPQADLAQCARCHGDEGIARDTEVPNLAGQNEAYLVNQLRAFRSGARRHPDMRFMSRTMTDAEIEAYAAYYTALKP